MSLSLLGACQRLQEIARGISGVAFAPATLVSEGALVFPYVESFPISGSGKGNDATWFTGLHVIRTRIHICRFDAGVDVVKAADLIQAFLPAVLADNTLAGTVDTVVHSAGINYTTGGVQYPTATTFAVTFDVSVKITGQYA